MVKPEVRGNASKTVDYDLMKIKLDFHAKEKTATEASKKVMRECEEFLGILKKGGVDINNTEEYKQVLLELKALAEKIKYEYFARAFDTAYRILDGTATPNLDNAP